MAALGVKAYAAINFSNDKQFVRARWDFAVDGGASGVQVDLFEADGPILVTDFYAVVKTTLTSGGSAALSVGITGDSDKVLDSIAYSALTANVVVGPVLIEGTPNTSSLPLYLADGAKLYQAIEVSTLTAGVIEYIIGIMKP